ncbi:ATP-dependent endonuclease [Halobacillus sp. Marseille-Q1614]|uniref:ATP-dependent nuclease n=1 Tax=Halobacillus sp. Marseille-Q1614 TaxID=2709134 RepID=UPI00156DEDE6|nr:AAA family ATPase [Halobacillus sp. Marseille-Q1614]
MYIDSIKIYNYKSIAEMEFIHLKDSLNVFVGKNNSGKSNILKSLNAFFNSDSIQKNEVSKLLSVQLEGNRIVPTIEVRFNKEESNVYTCYFGNKEKTHLNKRMLDDSRKVINSENETFPKFIYLSRDNEIRDMQQNIAKILPEDDDEYSKIMSNANQFMSEIFDSTYKLYADKRYTEEPDLRLIDEFGDDDHLQNKSSGTQMAALMSMTLSLGLNTNSKNGFIIAIDEPEASLHVGLQKKLFKFLKELSIKHQVIISTHSLIFLDKSKDENIFLVERDSRGRTRIDLKKHKKENWKMLRELMGASISDGMLLGDFNLVVEGRTEQLVFPRMIEILKTEKEIKLDEDRINIISAEGAKKMEPFLSILKDKVELPFCLFLDNDKDGLDVATKISKKKKYDNDKVVIPKKPIYNSSEFEDLFEDEILYSCINSYLAERVANFTKISDEELNSIRNQERFNVFTNNLENHLNKVYPDQEVEIGKLSLAYLIKENLENSNQFNDLKSAFKEMDLFFLRRS